jgi:hypothetical protein
VLPIAIAADAPIEASLVALATNAPTATAGQKRVPNRKSAAIAMPVGAQTGVMTPCATESSIPSLAAAT